MARRHRLKYLWSVCVLLSSPVGALRLERGEYLPLSQVRPGLTGVGYTVFEGTRIEPFQVKVLGVLEKIDFGADMILVRITSGPVVEKGYGSSPA
jgi:hypothetical protein